MLYDNMKGLKPVTIQKQRKIVNMNLTITNSATYFHNEYFVFTATLQQMSSSLGF